MSEEQLGLDGIQPLPQRFSIEEAAKATGKSVYVIRRAIKAGKIETTRNPLKNSYEMTLEALLRAGFDLQPVQVAKVAPTESADTRALEARVKDLESQLEEARLDKERLHQDKIRLYQLLEMSQRETVLALEAGKMSQEETVLALKAANQKRWRLLGARKDR